LQKRRGLLCVKINPYWQLKAPGAIRFVSVTSFGGGCARPT